MTAASETRARAFSKWRLVTALTVMGTLLLATASGPWAFWPCALLWAAPPMAAMRCLPLPLGLGVVLVSGVLGRALPWLTELTAAEALVAALAATASLLPALALDRLIVTRVPVLGVFAWPFLVAATFLAMRATPAADLTAPVADLDGMQLAAAAHPAVAVGITGIVAQGFASMATVLNWHVPDPFPQDVRERGVRVAALVSFAFLLAFAVAGALL